MQTSTISVLLLLLTSILIIGCDSEQLPTSQIQHVGTIIDDVYQSSERKADYAPAKKWLAADQVYNKEAPIPPQCYTKTDQVNNPCYVCHQSYQQQSDRPNKLNDGFQQGSYAFSDIGVSNSWRNLFVDRRRAIEKISDDDILT